MRPRIEPLMGGLAGRLGVSVGQAYTICTGLAVAVLLAGIGLPPVLRGAPALLAGAMAPRSEQTSAGAGGMPPVVSAPPVAGSLGAITVPFQPASSGATWDDTSWSASGESASAAPSPLPASAKAPGTTGVLASVSQPGAPEGVAVAPDGTIYVATNNAAGRGGSGSSAIMAFESDGTAIGSWLIPDQPPERSNGLTGLAVDPQGAVWALDAATARVLRLDPAKSTIVVVATIADIAVCTLPTDDGCESGIVDQAPELRGIAFTPSGRALVTDRTQGLIWAVSPIGVVTRFAAIDDRAPGEGPWGVTVAESGAVIVTVTGLLSVPPGQAAVVSIAVGDDGAAGARSVLASFASADRPTGVAAGASGGCYVALTGANQVVAITADGAQRRYDGGTVAPGFDAPIGLALRERSLLVTNQSTAADATRWVVFDMAVDDRRPSI